MCKHARSETSIAACVASSFAAVRVHHVLYLCTPLALCWVLLHQHVPLSCTHCWCLQLTVANTDARDARSPDSNFGASEVDIAAPGDKDLMCADKQTFCLHLISWGGQCAAAGSAEHTPQCCCTSIETAGQTITASARRAVCGAQLETLHALTSSAIAWCECR